MITIHNGVLAMWKQALMVMGFTKWSWVCQSRTYWEVKFFASWREVMKLFVPTFRAIEWRWYPLQRP